MINNAGPLMKSQFISGFMGEVGTVMAYAAMPMLHTARADGEESDEERVKLFVLLGDLNGDIDSRHYYPQDQWDAYCEWVKFNLDPRKTRFLVSSQLWIPSPAQHKQLLDTALKQKKDKKTYLSAVVGTAQKVPMHMRAIYAAAALACRIKDGIPIKFFPDGDLRGALEYMKISERHLFEVEELLEELQRAIDRRNGRPVLLGAR